MERWIQIVRVAGRRLARTPGFTLTAAGTLALGIGIATAVVTVAHTVVLRRLPVQDQERLIVLWGATRDGRFDNFPLGIKEVREFATRARSLERVEFFSYDDPFPKPIRNGDRISRLRQTNVSGGFFDLLGARPALGRLLRPDDDRVGAAPVAVLSFAAWRQIFGGDPGVVGRRLVLYETGVSHTIVGVAPRGFEYPGRTEFWAPVIPATTLPGSDSSVAALDVLARLRPGRSAADARVELTQYFSRPGAPSWHRAVAGVAHPLSDAVLGNTKPALFAFLAAAALLLIITCVNVANLLLVRGLGGARDVAVRASLGASRAQLLGELLTESAMLAVAGGVAGTGLAIAAVTGFVAIAPADIPRLNELGMSASVGVAAFAIAAMTLLLAGVVPAFVSSRTDLQILLRAGGRGGSASRAFRLMTEGLVIAQVAIALLVLSAAGLVTRSLTKLDRVDLALGTSGVLIGELAARYDQFQTQERLLAAVDRVAARVAATPGVTAVSPVLAAPFSGSAGWDGRPPAEGERPDEAVARPMVNLEVVTPDYFARFGIPVIRGRRFANDDRTSANGVVMISASTAKAYWPGDDALGKRFRLASGRLLTVIGVVPDTRYRDLRQPRASLYVLPEHAWFGVPTTLAIRASGPPTAMVPAIRRAVEEADPDLSLVSATPFESLLEGPLAQPRMNAVLLGGFALSAAALAAVGLLGVMATMVRLRARELAVRQALGATTPDIVRIVVGRGMAISLVGTGVGVLGALATNRLLLAILFEVTPSDSLTLGAAAALLLGCAALATVGPVVASIRIPPVAAVRAD
jgi:predicted permease